MLQTLLSHSHKSPSMVCPCYSPSLPSPRWHSPFPPQKVQFVVTFIENGSNGYPSLYAFLKAPSEYQRWWKGIVFLDFFFFFLSLCWVKKVFSEDVSFVLVFFHLDPLGCKGENISHFPKLRVRERKEEQAVDPRLAQLPSPFPGSGSFTGTSYCFHNTVTGNIPQRLWPWSQSTATTPLLWKTNQPKSSFPEEYSSALTVTTSLVQCRVNT